MKRISTYLLAAVCSVLLFSCQTELSETFPQSEDGFITLTCRIVNDTKVSIDGQGKTRWEVGDQIFVHGEQGSLAGKGQIVTLKAEDIKSDGKTATITFSEEKVPAYKRDDCVSSYYACYPAAAVVANWYMYYYGIYNNTNLPLMQGYDDGQGHMIFRNLCSALSFKVNGDYDSYVFSSNAGETVGWTRVSARLALRNDGVNYKWNIPYDSELDASLKNTGELTSLSGNLTCVDGTADNFIYFFNGTDFSDGFTIKFLKDGNVVKTLSTQTHINLERNEYKPLGDITSHLKDYEVPEDVASLINASTDLSETESANCYLLNAATLSGGEKYKFKAVKGNSSSGLPAISSVEVLWETCNGEDVVQVGDVIAAADFSRDSGDQYVHFQLPASVNAGNALIAAKNPGGQIIWSWHIWIASSAVGNVSGVTTNVMMDRNLGALSVTHVGPNPTPESYGLLYQWGRKDPFPCVRATSSSFITMSHTTTQTSGPVSAADLIKNPTVFYTTTDKEDYLDVSDATRWGAGTDKSVNDPCPAGYRVPDFISNDVLWTALTAGDYTSFGYNLSDRWFKLGNAVFPVSGAYSYGGWFSYVGERAVVWSNEYQKNEPTPHLARSHIFKVGVGGDSVWGSQKAFGASVRCVSVSGSTPADPQPDPDPFEVKDGDVVLVTNAKVEKFVTEVTYTENNYLITHILDPEYGPAAPGNSDKPAICTIHWEANPGAGTPTARLWEDDGWSREYTNLSAQDNYLAITNLRPNANYHYEVKAGGATLTSGSFQTTGHVHQVFFPSSVRNARDLGGWQTKDGSKTVKYRKIYRGGRMQESTLTSEGKAEILAEGIRAQLDLRGHSDVQSVSPMGEDFTFCAPVIEEGYVQLLKNDQEKCKQCIEFIMQCVHDGKPVYYHCSLGRDRTGTISMLILGLLGVDEGEISKEYELTQFAPHYWATSDGEGTKMTRKVDYKSAAGYIWEFAGESGSFADGVEAYLLSIGISQSAIDEFRSSMLE